MCQALTGNWLVIKAGKPLTHARRIALPDKHGQIPDLTSANFKDQIDIDALKRGEKRYIWAVGALGRVFVGEEELVGKDPQTGKEWYRGHPTLVAGGPLRGSAARSATTRPPTRIAVFAKIPSSIARSTPLGAVTGISANWALPGTGLQVGPQGQPFKGLPARIG